MITLSARDRGTRKPLATASCKKRPASPWRRPLQQCAPWAYFSLPSETNKYTHVFFVASPVIQSAPCPRGHRDRKVRSLLRRAGRRRARRPVQVRYRPPVHRMTEDLLRTGPQRSLPGLRAFAARPGLPRNLRPRRPGSSALARRFAYVRGASATHSNVGTGYTWTYPAPGHTRRRSDRLGRRHSDCRRGGRFFFVGLGSDGGISCRA